MSTPTKSYGSGLFKIGGSEMKGLLQERSKAVGRGIKLDEYDIEAIKKAKAILIENLHNPPGIIELAKMVRINDFKLKVGFKAIFKTTPHQLLLEYKMELAMHLLQEGSMNISEIAKHLGYAHATNFTIAFKKRFGLKPIDIMKRREYYYYSSNHT